MLKRQLEEKRENMQTSTDKRFDWNPRVNFSRMKKHWKDWDSTPVSGIKKALLKAS